MKGKVALFGAARVAYARERPIGCAALVQGIAQPSQAALEAHALLDVTRCGCVVALVAWQRARLHDAPRDATHTAVHPQAAAAASRVGELEACTAPLRHPHTLPIDGASVCGVGDAWGPAVLPAHEQSVEGTV